MQLRNLTMESAMEWQRAVDAMVHWITVAGAAGFDPEDDDLEERLSRLSSSTLLALETLRELRKQ